MSRPPFESDNPAVPQHPAAPRSSESEPADALWWYRKGAAHLEARELDEAEDALRHAALLAPHDPRPLALLGRIYLLQARDTEAVEVIQRALGLRPVHPDALYAFGLLSVHLGETDAVAAAVALLREAGGTPAQIERLAREHARLRLAPPPAAIPAEPTAHAPDARTWDDDEIAIVCGRTRHAWSPRSLEHGVGGSEEAVIRLSHALTRLGWRVTVYNRCGDEAGTYDGVVYRPFEALCRTDRFNVVVGWRNVRLFDQPFDARQTYLWLHDYPEPELYTRNRLAHIDRIFVLSAFHRAALPRVPDEQFIVTANGLDLEAFERLDAAGIPRNPSRCLYASSYDRGLEVLLGIWGDVRRAVPEAELHVFYGWQGFDDLLGDPAVRAWKTHMEQLLKQPGVHHHGRVGHERILRETMAAGVLAYPCTFAETSCITAMKAQAAGAVPVVIGYGALDETVRYGLKLPAHPGGACPPEQAAAYRDQLVWALRNPAWQDQVRAEMIPWARQQFAWTTVARQWDAVIRDAARRLAS